MSTHKHFDKICCVILAVTLVLTVLFMSAESFGVQKASTVMRYEKKLFDTSNVHTIDIIMEDWDDFIKNCTSEEYSNCTVMIDNDAYKNVAIRAKGNTSLTRWHLMGMIGTALRSNSTITTAPTPITVWINSASTISSRTTLI